MRLGALTRVDLRMAWNHESLEFTPWLAQSTNLTALGETIGMELELFGQEEPVGPYRADIVCKDTLSNTIVLVENQLEKTDHIHLGQILTYAAGLEAKTIVWIASRFTEEHRAALDWLNEITQEEYRFFGLEIELWRIDDSAPAPKFNIVCSPNDWSRSVKEIATRHEGLTPIPALQLKYWTAFNTYQKERHPLMRSPKPYPQSWASFSIGRTGFSIEATVHLSEQLIGVRLYILCDDLPPKSVFKYFASKREEIEAAMGEAMEWSDLPGKKGAVISMRRADSNVKDESHWPALMEWHATAIQKMDRAFRPLVKSLSAVDVQGA